MPDSMKIPHIFLVSSSEAAFQFFTHCFNSFSVIASSMLGFGSTSEGGDGCAVSGGAGSVVLGVADVKAIEGIDCAALSDIGGVA